MEEVKDQVKEENIDNVLSSVNDEYLSKKKRIKKITYSIILSIVFALATIIIVMSSIRVDLKPTFINNPSSYSVYIAGTEKMYIDETSKEYDEFYSLYNNSFNISYLTALFTGKLGSYKIEETLEDFYSNESTKTGMSSALKTSIGNNYIKLSYTEAQQLKYADGKDYYSAYNSTKALIYEDVYFTLNTENKDSDLTFYFGTKGATSKHTITKITVRANTFALYLFVFKI